MSRLSRANRNPELIEALRTTRDVLPGDAVLSPAGDRPSDVIGRFLAEREEVTASREAGLAAIQVWQALSERLGRGAGTVDVTILFTDLVDFSSWVLEAGDELALELLREVARVVEPCVGRYGGRVVKRLGDGHMAAFASAAPAVDAALEIQAGLAAVSVAGYAPRLRAGLHRGRPRRMRGDYLGTDVNIAARVGEAAGPGEVLVSQTVLAEIDASSYVVRRRRGFRAKGAPRDLDVYAIRVK